MPELSTRRLLTMTWLDGRPLLSFKAARQESAIASPCNMFRAWYVPFYDTASSTATRISATTRCGDDLDLNLLDFGCIRVFRPNSSGA